MAGGNSAASHSKNWKTPHMKFTIENLSKQYRRDFWGLRELDLELGSGVIGLLGPNGAGKSTLMRMLATITQPTEGTIKWNGIDIAKSPDPLRSILGYLPQDFGVYPNLSAIEFLEYMAAIKGMDSKASRRRIEELLEVVNLKDAAKRPLGGYSGGMKQRMGIAQALLNDPQLLIVDEPTVGLDPEERVRFRNLLSDLSGQRIVLLSTHIVSDVEAIATEIVIINKGRKLQHAAPETLLVVYVLLWYVGLLNKVPELDYIGLHTTDYWLVYLLLSLFLLAAAIFGRSQQLNLSMSQSSNLLT
jgi:ABC-type multidrug transport system ATPase subunit